MRRQPYKRTAKRISSIIHNEALAWSIHESVTSAVACSSFRSLGGDTVWEAFRRSLRAAIRDIEGHPRGKLFRRLIKYGPHHPDDPEALTSDGETILSDPECGLCVQFIFSHMVNRFKGELAEILAIDPCLKLIRQLQDKRLLPKRVHLYWGDAVEERRATKARSGRRHPGWGGFTKGADGLIVERMLQRPGSRAVGLKVHGVVEVKSMSLSDRKVSSQTDTHISRLRGGVRLGGVDWPPECVDFSRVLRIIVVPSTWKLSRGWHWVGTDGGRQMVPPKESGPPARTQSAGLHAGLWKIRLAWSQEALEQAAYEMTFWYMSQVGKHVFKNGGLPRGWEAMTPEEAGYNAIKMMLYYIPLRYISKRQERLAIKLYNIYSFGYPLGVDSKDMLWPEDFGDPDDAGRGGT